MKERKGKVSSSTLIWLNFVYLTTIKISNNYYCPSSSTFLYFYCNHFSFLYLSLFNLLSLKKYFTYNLVLPSILYIFSLFYFSFSHYTLLRKFLFSLFLLHLFRKSEYDIVSEIDRVKYKLNSLWSPKHNTIIIYYKNYLYILFTPLQI